MKFVITHPTTNKPDAILTLTVFVVVAITIKAFFEGSDYINLGHLDAATYAAVLTPVLGAHGMKEWKTTTTAAPVVDNPDVGF